MIKIKDNIIIHISLLLLISLDLAQFLQISNYNFLGILLINEIAGFFIISVIPGTLLLKIIRITEISLWEKLLYSLGLSLSLWMFLGFLMNLLLTLLGNQTPLSQFTLLSLLNITILTLITLNYYISHKKRNIKINLIKLEDIHLLNSVHGYLIILLPFLMIIGTYIMNLYGNNYLLIISLIIIALMPILVAFNKMPKELFIFSIISIGISLLFFRSLISSYFLGYDIYGEYYYVNLVIQNSFWNFSTGTNTNSSLGIIILGPLYSLICRINLVWVFKVVYPLLYSLVPVGLFLAYKKQTNAKIAFLSVFFFMATITYFSDMVGLMKQSIAEIFFVLIILLLINQKMADIKKNLLIIVFSASLIFSHYGLSYIFLISLILVLPIIFLMDHSMTNYIRTKINSNFNNKIQTINKPKISMKDTISITFVLFFIILTLVWYMNTTGSSVFTTVTNYVSHMFSSIFTDFLSPEKSQGLGIIIAESNSPLHKLSKYVTLLLQLFIAIGTIFLFINWPESKFNKKFVAFCFAFFIIDIAGIVLPFFSGALNSTRLFHITLFFLAPLAIIGGIYVLHLFNRLIQRNWLNKKISLKILTTILIVYFLFNIGLVYELFDDDSRAVSLNNKIDYGIFNEKDAYGALWLHNYKTKENIYADGYRFLIVSMFNYVEVDTYLKFSSPNIYIYLGSFNTIENKFQNVTSGMYNNTDDIVKAKNKIYENGGSAVYKTHENI